MFAPFVPVVICQIAVMAGESDNPYATPAERDEPLLPSPPPKIPPKKLWLCLLMPTLVTLVSVPMMFLGGTSGYAPNLFFLPLVSGPVAGLLCTPWWVRLLRIRYAARSLVLLGVAYPLGQLIITPVVGFGGCMATFYVISA